MGCQRSRNQLTFNVTLDSEYFTQSEARVKLNDNLPVKILEEKILQFVQDKFNRSRFKIKLLWEEVVLKSSAVILNYQFPQECKLKSQVEYMGDLLSLKLLINGQENRLKMYQNSDVRSLYQAANQFVKSDFKIYYKENELEVIYTLANYGIEDESQLKLVCTNQKQSRHLWNSKRTGLILRGICENPNCQAFQQKVICNLGFGLFNASKFKSLLECPVCLEMGQFLLYGFHNCQYLISDDIKNCDEVCNFKIARNTKWKKEISEQQKTLVKQLSLKYYQDFNLAEFSVYQRLEPQYTNQSLCVPTQCNFCSHNQLNYTFLDTDRLGKDSVASSK